MSQARWTLVFSALFACMAGLAAWRAIRNHADALSFGWAAHTVLCAATDMPAGSVVVDAALARCELPERLVGPSLVTADDGSAELIVGQKLLVPLRKSDPILLSHLAPESSPELAASVPPGARAVALDLPEKGTVNQWIRPGDHVDVVSAFRDLESQETVTVTLLENVIVLATGASSGQRPAEGEQARVFRGVVLLTLPEEAERLVLAAETGQVTLLLRSPDDSGGRADDAIRQKTDARTLLSGERSDALRRTRSRTFQQLDLIKGTQREVQRAGWVPVLGGDGGVP